MPALSPLHNMLTAALLTWPFRHRQKQKKDTQKVKPEWTKGMSLNLSASLALSCYGLLLGVTWERHKLGLGGSLCDTLESMVKR